MQLRVLNGADVRSALPMAAAIETMKDAYRELSLGKVTLPLRSRIDMQDPPGALLLMPAVWGRSDLAVKIVSVFPGNARLSLPTLHALVVVFDTSNGRPLALLEGSSLTALRTGAGSGAATDLLARTEANVAAIFGSGEQARTQLEAVATVRRLKRVWVVGRNRGRAEAFASLMAGQGPIPRDIRVADRASQAVREADIICTATTSFTPVFDGSDLAPGAHVNAIGGFTPEMQEIDSVTIRRCRVFVDSRSAALAEAGDLIRPLQAGDVGEDVIQGEIGDVISGKVHGRTSPEEITLFKSVGLAVQDAAAATRALENARSQGIGHVLEL